MNKDAKSAVFYIFAVISVKLDNYWDAIYNAFRGEFFMLIRKQYLDQLIQSKDLNLIKVITGVRRSGKSTLLLQYKDFLDWIKNLIPV